MSDKVLLVNACMRGKNESRTYDLANFFLKKYMEIHKDAELKEIILEELNLKPFDKNMLEERDRAVKEGKDKTIINLAEDFSKYDMIVVAAPYWDMMFPSILKVFYEYIAVSGVTFKYEADGTPKGLCNAKKAVYITSAGGYIGGNNYGYDYTKGLFEFMGIKENYILKAEGLDIYGNDVEEIMNGAKKEAEILSEKI